MTGPTYDHVYQNHHLDSTRWDVVTPRDDDIVISTSYKSGTTWTQWIVYNLIFLRDEQPPPFTLVGGCSHHPGTGHCGNLVECSTAEQ